MICPSCKSSNNVIRLRQSMFNGSYYNYKKMVSRLYPEKETWEVSNCLLEDGRASLPPHSGRLNPDKASFTGIVIFHDSHLVMKKGDSYIYPIECKCGWKK